jgi:hypothetical protein
MVAHRPLKFSTDQHDAVFVAKRSKPRNRKPKKSPEDADFVPKVPKPHVTMPYAVNGYGTKNKAKALYRKSNNHHHGPNRATSSGHRVDAHKKPYVFRPAPEPSPFDCRVHNESHTVFGPEGNSVPNKSANWYSKRKQAAKKAIKKACEKADFNAILSEAEVLNQIKLSLLELENKFIFKVDCRIDGETYAERAAKYKKLTPEENVKSAAERREFVRNKMTVQLREHLYKRSLKADNGRKHIHYCNYASAVRVMRRVSDTVRQASPEPSNPAETPPSQTAGTPTPDSPSRLNPLAPSFVLRTVSDDSTMSPSRDSQDETDNNSPSTSERAILPNLRVNAIYNRGVSQLDRLLQQPSSFRVVREALDRASPISMTAPLPSIVVSSPPSPLIVVSPIPRSVPAPTPIASANPNPTAPIATNVAAPTAPNPVASAAPTMAATAAPIPNIPIAPTVPVAPAVPNPILSATSLMAASMTPQTAPISAATAAPTPVASAAPAPLAPAAPTTRQARRNTQSSATPASAAPNASQQTNNPTAPSAPPSQHLQTASRHSTKYPDDDDDDDSDPDSSDSSSSNDSSDDSSDDDKRRKKSRKKKKKKKKSKKRSTAKIVFELNKNASYQDFKPLEFHPELEKRQRSFLFFTRKLRQLCRTTPELRKVFEDNDKLRIPRTAKADAALYDFLLSKVSNKTATMLETYMSEHKCKDGITAYKFLRSLSAPQDPDSQHRALTNFRSLYLKDNEHLQLFNQRFNTALTNVQATGISISKNDTVDHYLRAVKTIITPKSKSISSSTSDNG